jgi:crotonobetainyl-CoA:carnitine CoA-transferase CaiB-like acyl-CoA transferase
MADWMTVPLLHFDYGGVAPARVGLAHPSIAPYGVYRLAEGEVLLAIQNEREWRRLCIEVLERPDMARDARFISNNHRVTNRPALDRELASVFVGLSREEAVRRLNAAAIA